MTMLGKSRTLIELEYAIAVSFHRFVARTIERPEEYLTGVLELSWPYSGIWGDGRNDGFNRPA
jgi:hypothetical protein